MVASAGAGGISLHCTFVGDPHVTAGVNQPPTLPITVVQATLKPTKSPSCPMKSAAGWQRRLCRGSQSSCTLFLLRVMTRASQ